jgi:rhamnosyltransferase
MEPARPRKRLGIFAHYDAQDEVRPSIEHYVRHLRAECDELVFVSTSALADVELAKVRPYCREAILRPNVGFDFAMWQLGLQRVDLDAFDEVVLANSSVLGPVRPLGDLFRRMAKIPCDFWGVTESREHCVHLQSYFLVFRARVLRSNAFRTFFEAVLPFTDKQQVIYSYELSLTRWFEEQGFTWTAAFPYAHFEGQGPRGAKEPLNPAVLCAAQLLRLGDPFVKAEVFRLTPSLVRLRDVQRALAATGYGDELLRLDRRARK